MIANPTPSPADALSTAEVDKIKAVVQGAGNAAQPGASYATRFAADTALGSLGDGWTLLGPNALLPATQGQVLDGKFTAVAGSVVYATRDLQRPVNWIGAKVGWLADTGGVGQTTAAFLISPAGGAPSLIANAALHVTLTRTALAIGYIASQTIVNFASITLPRTIPLNTEVVCDFTVDGNYIAYSVDGFVGRVKMPAAADIGLGAFVTWEIYHAGSTNADRVYFSEVWAGARAPGRHGLLELCVGAWNFETTAWLDSSGQGLTLTNNGGATVASGRFGNALSLAAASSQFLSLTDTPQVRLAGKDWTFVCWINPTALPTSGNFMSIFNKGSTNVLELDVFLDSAGKINAVVSPTGSTSSGVVTAISVASVTPGAWTMILVSYSHQDTRLRLALNNGAPVTQVATGVFKGTSPLRIGYTGRLGAAYFNGLIDAYALFSTPPGHGGVMNAELQALLWADGAGRAFPY